LTFSSDRASRLHPLHLAFAAPDRATVDAFHAAALDAGGTAADGL
jgi:hypothetical protein